jgi:hypothetical protein
LRSARTVWVLTDGNVLVAGELQFDPRSALRAQIRIAGKGKVVRLFLDSSPTSSRSLWAGSTRALMELCLFGGDGGHSLIRALMSLKPVRRARFKGCSALSRGGGADVKFA